jgi:hypothetical protein
MQIEAIEIGGLLFTGVFFILCEVLQAKIVFILVAISGWFGYAKWNLKKQHPLPELVWRAWGFRPTSSELIHSIVYSSIPSILIICWIMTTRDMMTASIPTPINALSNSPVPSSSSNYFVQLLLIYPVWGCIQQWLVLSIGARSISITIHKYYKTDSLKLSQQYTIVLVGALFGIIHLFEPLLAIGCFFMGMYWTFLYFQYSCIYPLGFWHGIVATIVYFFVLHRDPIQELL